MDMMEKIDIVKVTEYTSPNPVTMVCTTKPDGTPNLAPVSWFTYLSFNPPTVGFAMGQPSCTGGIVRDTGKAVIAIPGIGMEDDVIQCGMCSGRDTDKSDMTELMELEGTDIRIPAKSKAALCVTMQRYEEVGDHYLYICSVDSVYGDADKTAVFAWDGYARIAPAKSE